MVGVLIDLWETSICFRRADGGSVRHFNAIAVDRIDGNRERMTMVRLRWFGGLCDVINALWLNVWRGKKNLDIEFLKQPPTGIVANFAFSSPIHAAWRRRQRRVRRLAALGPHRHLLNAKKY